MFAVVEIEGFFEHLFGVELQYFLRVHGCQYRYSLDIAFHFDALHNIDEILAELLVVFLLGQSLQGTNHFVSPLLRQSNVYQLRTEVVLLCLFRHLRLFLLPLFQKLCKILCVDVVALLLTHLVSHP